MDDMPSFEGFEFFSDENMDFPGNRQSWGNGTVVDKLGAALNSDGLLKPHKSNKVELSGKRLKINGEKMPSGLFEKYKSIYEQATGALLTRKSKIEFEVVGKSSKRKVRSF